MYKLAEGMTYREDKYIHNMYMKPDDGSLLPLLVLFKSSNVVF